MLLVIECGNLYLQASTIHINSTFKLFVLMAFVYLYILVVS